MVRSVEPNKTKEITLSMLSFIAEVIAECGGRVPGSPEEKRAQQIYAERVSAFTDNVITQEFTACMNAKFASMKLFCLVYYICLGLYWFAPMVALMLAAVNAVFFLGHVVTYRDWLDFMFPKGTSLNVTAVLEPQGEVKSTILVAGHMDSVYEFQWWYKLKNLGGFLTFVSGFLFPLYAIFLTVALAVGAELYAGAAFYFWLFFAFMSPATLVMFFIHGSVKVDGAIDNLSGVATALEVGKRFAHPAERGKSILQHTRLKLVSFGAEEPGLMGSKAYVRENFEELKREGAILLNVDSVKETHLLAIVRSELNVLVKYPKELVTKMQASFSAAGVKPKAFDLSIGASDAARFGMKGLPALTIAGIESDRLDPTYHTRLDKLEAIAPEAMEKTQEILKDFIIKWDAEQQ